MKLGAALEAAPDVVRCAVPPSPAYASQRSSPAKRKEPRCERVQ